MKFDKCYFCGYDGGLVVERCLYHRKEWDPTIEDQEERARIEETARLAAEEAALEAARIAAEEQAALEAALEAAKAAEEAEAARLASEDTQPEPAADSHE